MWKQLIAGLAVFGFAEANNSNQRQGQQQLAKFDDITVALPGTPFQSIGTYKGLNYNNLNVINVGQGAVGVKPQSSPNVAVLTLLTGGVNPTASLTPASGNKDFTLENLYLGCVLSTQETAASAPVACKLDFSFYTAGRSSPYKTTASFSPNGLLTANMQRVNFPQFSKIRANKVVIELSASALTAGTSALIDNVSYETYKS